MTYDINEYYGVTISQARVGKPYIAVGEIFSRKTMQNVGITVQGEGRTWSAAVGRAMAEAHSNCPTDLPDDI
ncbi:hypothetical protein [Phenylobacterium montanum]|uniref:Uncharacterized protein n=1 Tax=Phenylobacterium montanum TaxID=2823693 RepID=A0A975FXD5_9CAUL|nr:hypothetical protein [Caulobacter sp. S6]QUD86051.1 hypothetical protein KCG34_13145 [Caulobacter sp. S6]